MAKSNAKKKKKASNIIEVNFEGVKSFKTAPEGTYTVEVKEVEQGTSGEGNDKLDWTFQITEGKQKGGLLWTTTSLLPQALFKLRDLLDALGMEVPDDAMELDLDDVVGMTCGVVVYHEDYNGKPQAKISDFISADDVGAGEEEDEEDEEEKPKKGKSKSKASKDEEDEEEEDDETPDVSKMDEDELAELVSELGLDVELDDFKSIKKKRAAVEEAISGSSDEEEEEDAAETYSTETIEEMDEDDLQALNKDLKLKIKGLDDMKPKLAVKAVLKALKKAGLLED